METTELRQWLLTINNKLDYLINEFENDNNLDNENDDNEDNLESNEEIDTTDEYEENERKALKKHNLKGENEYGQI